jgi:hypothetical protein
MCCEIAGLDPSADGAGGNLEPFRDLSDREEIKWVIPVTTDTAKNNRFRIGVAGGRGSGAHALCASIGYGCKGTLSLHRVLTRGKRLFKCFGRLPIT